MSIASVGFASRKMPLKFCANLAFQFNETDSIVERFRLAKAAGFRAVEMAFPSNVPLEELVAVKNETGLELILVNIDCSNGGSFGCASFVNSCEDFKKNLANTIKFAKAMDCKK